MIDPGSIECAGAADNPMHFITFLKQEIRKITAVLSGDAGNQGSLHCWRFRFSSQSAAGQTIRRGYRRPAPVAAPKAPASIVTLRHTATERRDYKDRDSSSRRITRAPPTIN